jgi:DegV family protein with EDD domain
MLTANLFNHSSVYYLQYYVTGEGLMSKIAVITDTDSSFSLEFANSRGIQLVPIMIQFGEKSYRDIYDIDNPETFSKIDHDGKLPSTSAPSPGQFVDAYKTAFENGAESILCFTVSGEVSATYAAALNACAFLPENDITVVDTRSLTMQQGYMTLAAVEVISQGANKQEAIAAAFDIRDRSQLFASLATLKYLSMSGRVSHLAAGVAGILNVKPILTIRNGKLDLLEKIRTQSKAWQRTIDLTREAAAGREIERMCILHVNVPDAASEFEKLIRSEINCPTEITLAELGPGLSIHSGVGLVGVVVVFSK